MASYRPHSDAQAARYFTPGDTAGTEFRDLIAAEYCSRPPDARPDRVPRWRVYTGLSETVCSNQRYISDSGRAGGKDETDPLPEEGA
jgi:hypothetical protein